jgi:hypothetical protein
MVYGAELVLLAGDFGICSFQGSQSCKSNKKKELKLKLLFRILYLFMNIWKPKTN